MSPTGQLVWFITGTSSGFGRDLVLELLQRGDKVIASARRLASIRDLESAGAHIVELDVTLPVENLKSTAEHVVGIYDRVDVVVNNAGYIEIGALEEKTPEETFKQFNTNVFGALNVARAFLPYQRKAKSGTVVFIGSIAGWHSGEGFGLYAATKHAIRALAESLDSEIVPLGLRSLYFEPGHFRTPFLSEGKRSDYTPRIADYAPTVGARVNFLKSLDNKQPGDPKKFVELLVDFVRKIGPFAEGVRGEKVVPGGVPVGSDSYTMIKERLESRLSMMEEWKDVICCTDLPKDL